jgi:hypothetical protein
MEHLHLESIFEIVLTSKFLHGSQSHLRSLAVRHVAPINDPPSFPRLQILELDISWVDHKDPSTMTRLIQLLQGAPCIQDLSLVRPDYAEGADPVVSERLVDLPRVLLPHLRELHIRDFVEHVLVLLRVLPEPTHRLAIDVNSHMIRLSESHSLGNTHNAAILDRLAHFWTRKTGKEHLPGGKAKPTQRGHSYLLHFGSSVPSASVRYEGRCHIDAPHPILDHIDAIEITGEKLPQGGNWDHVRIAATRLPNLKRFEVKVIKTMKYLQAIEKWMKDRAKTQGPLTEFRIHTLQKVTVGKVEEVFARLRKAGAVENTVLGASEGEL